MWTEFFLSFESFPIFCRNHWHGSQNSIYVSRVKIAEKFFFVSFSEFLRFSSENFSDFWPKNFKKLWKLTSACPQEQLVALKFFKKFWTVLDFLQKPLAWFSKYYLRVQSKTCGRNKFFYSSFLKFSGFWAIFFLTSGQKLSRSCQNYLLRVKRNNLWLEFFFKFRIVSDFLQKPLAWFSKFYLRVQSKNCRKNFFCFLFRFFLDFERKIFRLLGKKLHEVFKTTFYVSRGTVCGLNFFSKVLNRFGFSAETFGMVFKFYLRVQSKNCGRISFFCFSFQSFFSKIERKFFRLLAKKLQNVVKTNFCVSTGTTCGFNFF